MINAYVRKQSGLIKRRCRISLIDTGLPSFSATRAGRKVLKGINWRLSFEARCGRTSNRLHLTLAFRYSWWLKAALPDDFGFSLSPQSGDWPPRYGRSRRVRRRAHQPALRFFTAFLAGAFAVPGAVFSGDLRLARSASIKLTTLPGAVFFAAAIGCRFCFLASSSASAAS